MDEIEDYVEPKKNKCFWNIQRLRADLLFPKKDDIGINISFSNDNDD